MNDRSSELIFRNWIQSLSHQYGEVACLRATTYLLHVALIQHQSHLSPKTIIQIVHVLELANSSLIGVRFRGFQISWLHEFCDTTDLKYDLTPTTALQLAAHYLAKQLLNIPAEDFIPAWEKSLLFIVDILNMPSVLFMRRVTALLEEKSS